MASAQVSEAKQLRCNLAIDLSALHTPFMSAGSSPTETVIDWDEVAVNEWLASLGLTQYQQQIIGGCFALCSGLIDRETSICCLRLRRSRHIRKYSLLA